MSIEWHPEAEAEFYADIEWYEGREPGLGDRFESAVLNAVAESVGSPESWPVWPGWNREPTVRSKRVATFPHRVVYCVEADVLTVLAVAAIRRRPGYWRTRLRRS